MNVAEVLIENEAAAWSVLENALKGGLPFDYDIFQFRFGDWPAIHLKIEGPNFHSSITPRLMDAFLTLQKNIYRTYAKLQYNQASGRLLTMCEKAELELVVEVHPGSSEYLAKFQEIGQKLVEGAINKMNGRDFVILGLSVVLGWTSDSMWKGNLATRSEQIQSETKIALSKEETRRMEIMREATTQAPYVAVAKAETEEIINKVLKSAVTARNISIGGQQLTGRQVQELVKPERTPSHEVRLDGEYRILKVDSSNPEFFKVELSGDNGRKFWAILQDATVTKERNKELLQEAEWSKKPINLMINGWEVRGEVSTASILDVKERF